jgi:hypothetical protein
MSQFLTGCAVLAFVLIFAGLCSGWSRERRDRWP